MLTPARPELLSLLNAVKADPSDLTSWLVLCDWLEEQPDESDRLRGEYSRLCFGRLKHKVYASDWERGERRRWIAIYHRHQWLGPMLRLQTVRLRDGLIEVATTGENLLQIVLPEVTGEQWVWVDSLRVLLESDQDCWDLLQSGLLNGLGRIALDFQSSKHLTFDLIDALMECAALQQARQVFVRPIGSDRRLRRLKKHFGKKFQMFYL
jgi:uncharacterized protein (TIGR02996 family)